MKLSTPSTPTPRRRRRRQWRRVAFALPLSAQAVFLKLPAVRNYLVARQREHVVKLVEALGMKISQAKVAAALGLSASRISDWRKMYRESGLDALVPKALGPMRKAKSGSHSVNLCGFLLPTE